MTRPVQADGEAGFTLVELMVVVFILSAITIMMFSFLDQATSVTGKATRDAQTEQDAQLALRTLTEDVRGAHPIGAACTTASDAATPALSAGYANCLQFTVVRNTSGTASGCPKTDFIYAFVGGILAEDRTDYNSSCTVTKTLVRRSLLTRVVNTAAQPLFTYYADDGSAIDVSANPAAVPTASSVKVALYVQYQSKSPILQFTSIVALRNNTSR